MFSDLSTLSEAVKTILQKHANASLPLTRSPEAQSNNDALMPLAVSATNLFPGARHPDAALSGLFLLLNCWERSHGISQDIPSREGSYWHGIAHRIEPDSSNAGYWFRKVGDHPIFPELHRQAQGIFDREKAISEGVPWQLKGQWDPFLFIDWCDEARAKPNSQEERLTLQMQKAEWQLLFQWCAAPAPK
ncbi:MAG: hypothetical protein JO182_15950 [Acidobacteriaceae bacterium]|nr:hypothetical protein [Acidobacteriaceae bacterium]MBV9306147.1 hypothetical protein [Acidobacteriaceae bacterium]MBV9679836.1 hypothetical protein [Acidobacteriaceae bacterium]MBV9939529.1 hypothetical protein [Acidobacteriaceae bacterium]